VPHRGVKLLSVTVTCAIYGCAQTIVRYCASVVHTLDIQVLCILWTGVLSFCIVANICG
jgi:hypothetical protein